MIPQGHQGQCVPFAENHRPGVEGMGTNRHHEHTGHVGWHNGASSRQRIGRRARRSSHDEAVGGKGAEMAGPHIHFQVDEPGERPFGDHQVIHRKDLVYDAVVAPYHPPEQASFLVGALPPEDFFQVPFRRVRIARSEEPQSSRVDAQKGYGVPQDEANGPEEGPISPDDSGKLHRF